MISEKLFRQLQRNALIQHFDANETFFLEREMTQLRAKTLEIKFPDLISRQLMPFANDIAPSATTYSYKVITPTGTAKFIGERANDLPRIDADATEIYGKVHPIGLSYGWDINELKEAARLNTPISDIKAKIAREACERGIDEILATGDLTLQAKQTGLLLTGIVNNADVVNNGIYSGAWWLNPTPPTPAVVLADLNAMVASVTNSSNSLFNANTVLLPTAHHTYIQQTPFSSLTGESILSVFLKNNKQIGLVKPWYRLNTAGAGNLPRGIVYQRDPSVLEGVVPQEFEQLPPQMKGLEVIIPCTARCGGVKIYQPIAMKYVDFLVA